MVVLDELTANLFDVFYNNFSSDEAIIAAVRNENACNPVLRTVSEIVLQMATQQNESRVELIRTGAYRLGHSQLDVSNCSSVCFVPKSHNCIYVYIHVWV